MFNSKQHAYTSWFIDAFNYAIFRRIHILNLSVGGPDWADAPFVDKVREASASGIVIVSAIGNDGPHWGTSTNPADQSDVIGVGGMGKGNKLAAFSSRGMTKPEIVLPQPAGGLFGGGLGYGRAKPDVVTMADRVWGPTRTGGCTKHSGTSVASPVVAGVLALLASTLPEPAALNPATAKQVLLEGAAPTKSLSLFEQGAGAATLLPSAELLSKYRPRASFHPAALRLAEQPCTYHWPYCSQPLYASAVPFAANVTIINALGAHGVVSEPPRWVPSAHADKIEVRFEVSETLWPWSGWLAIRIEVRGSASAWEGVAEGTVEMAVGSEGDGRATLSLPVSVRVIPTPPRAQRLLWDIGHSISYPPGFVPKDSFEQKEDFLDWHGDHPHTNFRELYNHLRGTPSAGGGRGRGGASTPYHIEILSKDFTSFDASLYGALLLIDPEEEYGAEESAKLVADVREKGLGLFVMADWYAEQTMEKLRFLDDNTHRYITPITGGANVPALNDLLRPFGIAFGDGALAGDWGFAKHMTRMVNGVPIAAFPNDGRVVTARVKDETTRRASKPPVFGAARGGPAATAGVVAVYGDSNCADSAHQATDCYWLFDELLPVLTANGGAAAAESLQAIGLPWGEEDAPELAPSVRQPERAAELAMRSRFWHLSAASSGAGDAPAETSGASPRFLRVLE